jgi:hypothetical protein
MHGRRLFYHHTVCAVNLFNRCGGSKEKVTMPGGARNSIQRRGCLSLKVLMNKEMIFKSDKQRERPISPTQKKQCVQGLRIFSHGEKEAEVGKVIKSWSWAHTAFEFPPS